MSRNRQLPKCGHYNIIETCSDCTKLLNKWEKKLQSSAKEEESFSLKDRPQNMVLLDKDVPLDVQLVCEYYDKLSKAVSNNSFESEIEQIIIEQKSKGQKICEIVNYLAKRRKRIHRETVRHVIRRFEHKWGIRKWTYKQMDLKPLTK